MPTFISAARTKKCRRRERVSHKLLRAPSRNETPTLTARHLHTRRPPSQHSFVPSLSLSISSFHLSRCLSVSLRQPTVLRKRATTHMNAHLREHNTTNNNQQTSRRDSSWRLRFGTPSRSSTRPSIPSFSSRIFRRFRRFWRACHRSSPTVPSTSFVTWCWR